MNANFEVDNVLGRTKANIGEFQRNERKNIDIIDSLQSSCPVSPSSHLKNLVKVPINYAIMKGFTQLLAATCLAGTALAQTKLKISKNHL
jgi:hypothetical protein